MHCRDGSSDDATLLLGNEGNSVVEEQWERELETEQQRLRRLASSMTVADFVNEANATLRQWENKPNEMYGRLAETIADLLNSAPYSGDKTAKAATWQIAEQTFARKVHSIPVPTLVRLLLHLASEPLSDRNDWPTVRADRASWWLETWNRLDQAMDPKFDPDDVPDLSAKPGAPKTEYYKQQFKLRQVEPHFKQTASSYLAHIYSLAPERPEELNVLLTKYLSNAARKQYFPTPNEQV